LPFIHLDHCISHFYIGIASGKCGFITVKEISIDYQKRVFQHLREELEVERTSLYNDVFGNLKILFMAVCFLNRKKPEICKKRIETCIFSVFLKV